MSPPSDVLIKESYLPQGKIATRFNYTFKEGFFSTKCGLEKFLLDEEPSSSNTGSLVTAISLLVGFDEKSVIQE
jgi:hypothetical protein